MKENRQQHSRHQGGEQEDQTRNGGETRVTKVKMVWGKEMTMNQTWKINSENNTEDAGEYWATGIPVKATFNVF